MRPYTKFGATAWQIMKEKGIPLKTVAESVGVTSQYISSIFAGRYSDGKAIQKRKRQIAEFLNMNINQ